MHENLRDPVPYSPEKQEITASVFGRGETSPCKKASLDGFHYPLLLLPSPSLSWALR